MNLKGDLMFPRMPLLFFSLVAEVAVAICEGEEAVMEADIMGLLLLLPFLGVRSEERERGGSLLEGMVD